MEGESTDLDSEGSGSSAYQYPKMDFFAEGKVYDWMREKNDPDDKKNYYWDENDKFVIEDPDNPGVNLLDGIKDPVTKLKEEKEAKIKAKLDEV